MKRTAIQKLPNISPGRPCDFDLCEPGATVHRMGNLAIIVGHSQLGWHLSISHPTRYPTWDEIAKARYQLIPNDVTMAMLLPPMEQFVNVHSYCLHIWQVPDPKES